MLPRVPGDQGSCGADYLPAGYGRERALLQHLLGAGKCQRLPDNRDMSESGASSLCGEQLVRGPIDPGGDRSTWGGAGEGCGSIEERP